MDPLIFHNDRIVSLGEARLSPGQAGLFMGWGVFTTLRIYRGIPFAFERHWRRCARDAARLAVPMPYQPQAVRRAVMELACANGRAESVARVTFIRNTGGYWAEAADRPPTDLLIFTRELVRWPAASRLRLERDGVSSTGPYAGTKNLSWALPISRHERAQAEGFDDALLENEKGQIAECTSANFFLVRAGKVATPPLTSGCLPGITREVLLERAPSAGIEIEEKELIEADLDTAEEVFIGSSTREVAPVGFISPRWNFDTPGKITSRLETLFTSAIQDYLSEQMA
jgi:branched-chain amino acid aminotransferase